MRPGKAKCLFDIDFGDRAWCLLMVITATDQQVKFICIRQATVYIALHLLAGELSRAFSDTKFWPLTIPYIISKHFGSLSKHF